MKIRKLTPNAVVLTGVVLALSLAVVPAALARGKPGGGTGGTGGTISLAVLTSPGDGLAHWNYKVTFNVSTTATTQPWVTLDCYQNGVWVSHTSNGIFPTSLNQVFTLSSSAWTSGAATCTAYLQNWDSYSKHGTITNLASMSFQVAP
jgi:hypothetical protein